MPTDGNLLRPSYSTQNKTSHTGVNQIIDPGQTLRRGGQVSPASAVGSVRTPPKSSYEPEIAGHAATFRKALASDEVKAMKGFGTKVTGAAIS